MTRIRLEIDHLQIHRPKKRWKLYFVVAAEHPTDSSQMVISIIPQNTILVVPGQHNNVAFESDGPGANGLFILSREMPQNRELNTHVYILHSRRTINEIGKFLKDIENGIGGQTMGLLTNILGTTNPWLAIARKALPLVGQILEKIPDRNMGFITMFERFGPEFENEVEVDRESRGGHITMVYSWAVEELA
jgi:hypothetical protein